MAKWEVTFDNDFVKQLEKLENFDEIAEYLLNESSGPLEESLKREMAQHKDTGDMINKTKKLVKKSKYGWFLLVRPTGKDKKGVRNMEKLVNLEFGNKHQKPTPIVTRAVKNAEKEVQSLMQRKFDEYVNK